PRPGRGAPLRTACHGDRSGPQEHRQIQYLTEVRRLRNMPLLRCTRKRLTSAPTAHTVCFVRRTITVIDRRLARTRLSRSAQMFQTPEQLIQIQKAALESNRAVTLKSLEGLEKLAELNLQAAKASVGEVAEQFRALFEAKDPQAIAELTTNAAQPVAEKFV